MFNSLIRSAAWILFAVFAGTAPALAQITVTLREGLNTYAGTTDARISSFSPNNNYGGQDDLVVRAETAVSSLVRFKIFAVEGGPVPDNATITSATLSLYKYWGAAATIRAVRLKRDWNEAQTTWNVAATGTSWQTAGANGANDIEPSADGQGTVGDGAANACNAAPWPAVCWLNINVTTGVQAFKSALPTPNRGWKIAYVSGGTVGDDKEFVSREHSSSALRPTLTITYTVPGQGCSGAFGGTPWPIGGPIGEIEAENFDCGGQGAGYNDLTPGNQMGSTYRPDESVDVWDIPLPAGGRVVRDFHTNEWMAYTINVTSPGTYNLAIKASSEYEDLPVGVVPQYRIEVNGQSVTANVDDTGNWDVYEWQPAQGTVSFDTPTTYVLKLFSAVQGYRVDQLRLTPVGPPDPDPGVDTCDRLGLHVCVRFEADPETTFSDQQVTSHSPNSTDNTMGVQNANNDSATEFPANGARIGRVDGGRDGAKAIRFATLHDDSGVNNSALERSEIAFDVTDTAGTPSTTDHWWAHSVYLPPDNQLGMPTDVNAEFNFLQFHGSKPGIDPTRQVAPNFRLQLFNEPGTNRLIFKVRSVGGAHVDQYGPYSSGNHNVKGQCIEDNPERDRWYDFVHRIRWSNTGQGLHEIWMRKVTPGNPTPGPVKKVLQQPNISTLPQNENTYLKMGLYHNFRSGSSSVIHDRLRRGNSFNAVRMTDFEMPTAGGVVACGGYPQ